MIIITKYKLVENPQIGFYVRYGEFVPCPCCNNDLKVIGSRKRKVKDSDENKKTLIIRRMRCKNCHKIHHELPDCLVPYKRYGSESIESLFSNELTTSDLAADEATLHRLRKWLYSLLPYFLSCLNSIAFRLGLDQVYEQSPSSTQSKSIWQRIEYYVGNEPGWLARIVRPVVNANLWIHTRSAFMSTSTSVKL